MTETGGPSMPTLPTARVSRRQLQLVLLLDCSGSMAGEKIASLNYAIRSALSELRTAAEENPEIDVRLSALKFSTGAEWHIDTPLAINDLQWEDLTAGGETAMGQALDMTVDFLNSGKCAGRQLPPIVLLVTDGYATDDFDASFERFMQHEAAKAALRIAVAIGDSADEEALRTFVDTDTTGIAPLCARSAPDLVKHIKWATTAPVKARSSPTNAPSNVEGLAQDTNRLLADDSEIVW